METAPVSGEVGAAVLRHKLSLNPASRSRTRRIEPRPHRGKRLFISVIMALAVWGMPALYVQGQELSSDPTVAPTTDKSNVPAAFTSRDLFRFYTQTTFHPSAFEGPIMGAALTQWVTGNPQEWGQGFPGYGRRVLSGYGRQLIANTIGLGVAFAAHEDPRHYPTGERTVWKRGLYAAREAVLSHNAAGGLMPAYSRIVGVYVAGFASNAWYPARNSNVQSSLYRGSTALASDIVWQEFKEFWPDARRKLRRH